MSTFCPDCRQDVVVSERGECLWCDTPTVNLTDAQVIFPPTGCAPLLTDDALRRAADLYYRRGQSLRATAKALLPGSGYASVRSLSAALSDQFKAHGLPVRSRMESAVRASTIHGRSRDPQHRHARRVARGEVRGVMCAGVRLQAPGKGTPCRLQAHTGSDYCRFHDPKLRAQVEDVARRARQRSPITGDNGEAA